MCFLCRGEDPGSILNSGHFSFCWYLIIQPLRKFSKLDMVMIIVQLIVVVKPITKTKHLNLMVNKKLITDCQ